MGLVADLNVTFAGAQSFSLAVYKAFIALGLPKGAAQLLTAHAAVSTGWGKGAQNYRLFGIKAGNSCVCSGTCASPSYDYTCKQTTEYTKGVPITITAPFRAYKTLAEGAKAALSLLQTSRYTKSYAYLKQGNEEYFAQLGHDGWYTAPVATVVASGTKALATVQKYTGGKFTCSGTSCYPAQRFILLASLAAVAGFAWTWYGKDIKRLLK